MSTTMIIIIYLIGCVLCYGRYTAYCYYRGQNWQDNWIRITINLLFIISLSWLSFLMLASNSAEAGFKEDEKFFKWKYDEVFEYYERKETINLRRLQYKNFLLDYKKFKSEAIKRARTKISDELPVVRVEFDNHEHDNVLIEFETNKNIDNVMVSLSIQDMITPINEFK